MKSKVSKRSYIASAIFLALFTTALLNSQNSYAIEGRTETLSRFARGKARASRILTEFKTDPKGYIERLLSQINAAKQIDPEAKEREINETSGTQTIEGARERTMRDFYLMGGGGPL